MSSSIKTFLFAAVTCITCSLLLTGAATGLKDRQDYNKRLNVQKNILKALNLTVSGKKYTSQEIEGIYTQNVKDLFINKEGELVDSNINGELPIHIVKQNDKLVSYAIPISGYGLWSTLYGYLAMEGDAETILGMTIYDHKETPGLGGECDKPWFQNQFKGKKITNADGEFVSVGIVKGKAKETVSDEKLINYVDGMSGATITTKGMDTFIRKDLKQYEVFAVRYRQ